MSAEELRSAAAAGNADSVKQLLSTGAQMDPDLEGRTALHSASANGHAAIVTLLLDAGAKINSLDAAGYSPLHQAATEGHESVVKILLKNGCHVDTQDELHGNTALHESAWKGFSRTLEVLCKKGANVYIKNNGGFTPLHLACQNGHNQCCRVLLLSACKPDVRNSQYGDTPLHTAARYGHAGVLRILISAFCNVNERNKNGDTALHISAAIGRNKLTRILLEAGSDQKLKNNQSETPRSIAERKQFMDVIRLMDDPPVSVIVVEEKKKSSKKRDKDSGTSQESKDKKDKHKKSKKHHKVHFFDKDKKGNVSPYGCHMYPDASHFPSLKLKSLPHEPLKNGEQYYADLAGNIKKGPRGLGYMCYCAPFFNHVEKKLDANKKELLDHIDSRNEDLKAKITHLEQRTHDQLYSLNQRMKESLALERGNCAERIDRRLFRERRELEQQQERCSRLLQQEMKTILGKPSQLTSGNYPNGFAYSAHNGNHNQPLLRSKSEDLLSETNSNQNSISLMSSTVTGTSRFTSNSHFNRTATNPALSGARPKVVNHPPNISRLKMKCMGYPDLKRESRSEGDLTSCHTETDSCIVQPIISHSYPVRPSLRLRPERDIPSNARYSTNGYKVHTSYQHDGENGSLWKNSYHDQSFNRTRGNEHSNNNSDVQPSTSMGHSNYTLSKTSHHTNHNHNQNRSITENDHDDLKSKIRTQSSFVPNGHHRDLHSVSNQNGNTSDILALYEKEDGSSFV